MAGRTVISSAALSTTLLDAVTARASGGTLAVVGAEHAAAAPALAIRAVVGDRTAVLITATLHADASDLIAGRRTRRARMLVHPLFAPRHTAPRAGQTGFSGGTIEVAATTHAAM
jgi:hypothetical protein